MIKQKYSVYAYSVTHIWICQPREGREARGRWPGDSLEQMVSPDSCRAKSNLNSLDMSTGRCDRWEQSLRVSLKLRTTYTSNAQLSFGSQGNDKMGGIGFGGTRAQLTHWLIIPHIKCVNCKNVLQIAHFCFNHN